MVFGRLSPLKLIQKCSLKEPSAAKSCEAGLQDDRDLVAAVTERAKVLSSRMRPRVPARCKDLAGEMQTVTQRFGKYSDALPAAQAAYDFNKIDDFPKSDGQKCLTRLPLNAKNLNKALNIPPGPDAITDVDLRNDATGFRAALYRSEKDGKIILVARDTQPDSLVDWKTNIDNGRGEDTAQYEAMRLLAGKLRKNGVDFDISGYSKGGGLAQEAGLISPESQVYVFNSSGLPSDSIRRTGAIDFTSLEERTKSFSSEGDFLTFMNAPQSRESQLANARFLRHELFVGDRGPMNPKILNPLRIDHRNPENPDGEQDPKFEDELIKFQAVVDKIIKDFEINNSDEPLFPPVRTSSHEVIVNSMSKSGQALGAREPRASLGKLIQHLMVNVHDPMINQIEEDKKTMKDFIKLCG